MQSNGLRLRPAQRTNNSEPVTGLTDVQVTHKDVKLLTCNRIESVGDSRHRCDIVSILSENGRT